MGNVHQLPGTEFFNMPTPATSLNLSPAEVEAASGGYVRPADQLKALHARGFVRAFRRGDGKGPVILERAHYDAVTRGQFGQQQAANDAGATREPMPPNRAGYRAKFGKKARG
jgi:hypothetical protein